jgi:hypothetical protein
MIDASITLFLLLLLKKYRRETISREEYDRLLIESRVDPSFEAPLVKQVRYSDDTALS